MSAIEALICAEEYRAEAGGLTWTLRRLSPVALLETGFPVLQLAPIGDAAPRSPSLGSVRAALQANLARLCAAVVAVQAPGQEVEALRLTLLAEEHNAAAGVVHVERLPAAVRSALLRAIDGQDGEAAQGIAASFRGGSSAPGAPGPDRPPVRDDSK